LAVSFWLNGLLAAVAILVFGFLVGAAMRGGRQPWLYLIGLVLIWSFVLLTAVWQSVGIWRSATRARRTHGRRFWPVAAQVVTVIGVINNANLLRAHAVPALRDAVAYCQGDPALGPRGVRILRDGEEIEVTGPFSWGVAQQLDAALTHAPHAQVVHLDSIGGRIGAAMNVADIIAARQLNTYVSHVCASACTLAFLAGKQRWIGEHGRLGFHSATLAGAANPIAEAGFRQAYQRYALPVAFLDRVFRTAPNEVWVPSNAELLEAHIITGVARDGMFAVSGFGPQPSLHDAEQQLLRLPLYAALQRADPEWSALMTTWDRTVSDGEPITKFGAEVRSHIASSGQRLLPVAPEDSLRQFIAMTVAETETLQRADPEACWRYLHNGQIDLRQYLSAEQLANEMVVSTQFLEEATAHPRLRLSPAHSKALIVKLMVSMRRNGLDPDAALAALRSDAPHAAYCPGLDALIRAALAWPVDDGGSPLRALFSIR
jgi:hypothetical protein